jgi:rare lipoprotein A (peptidoglycan hydrolase)
MKAIVLAAATAVATLVSGSLGANAGDWRDSILGASAFREPLPGAETPRSRSTAARASSTRQAPVRQAAASNRSSDDEAPQRKGRRSAPSSSGSLSGGETGIASFYWQPQRVASGGWFNPNAMTAAHKSLPFGTRVRVTRADNGNSVDVTINDRGPYVAGRIIDLSKAAASSLGITGQGLARVRVSVLGRWSQRSVTW